MYIGIIAAVAIVLGLVGFFLSWVNFSTTTETGFDALFQDGGAFTLYAVAMLVSLVGCLILLITEIKDLNTGGMKFLFILLSMILLICALVIFFDVERDAGIGVFVEIAAGIMLLVTSMAFALKK